MHEIMRTSIRRRRLLQCRQIVLEAQCLHDLPRAVPESDARTHFAKLMGAFVKVEFSVGLLAQGNTECETTNSGTAASYRVVSSGRIR